MKDMGAHKIRAGVPRSEWPGCADCDELPALVQADGIDLCVRHFCVYCECRCACSHDCGFEDMPSCDACGCSWDDDWNLTKKETP